jgi:precorrin-6A/cobalt-precorrin-6A reductase
MELSNDIPHVLILGGTTESRRLAERLAGWRDLQVTLSLAGRTRQPLEHPVPTRHGGFGGVAGLVNYLQAEHVSLLVDATHPFAVNMSQHAVAAAQNTRTPILAVRRTPWTAVPGDRWTEVESADAAIEALGFTPRRVFVTIGRNGLSALNQAPQHRYLIRTVDPVEPPLNLPDAHYIQARGPFDEPSERALFVEHAIERVVAKNSGGDATYGKLAAARALEVPVILIRTPRNVDCPSVDSVNAALTHICHVLGLGMERSV